MKKIYILIFLSISHLSIYGSGASLVQNFAEALLFPSNDAFVAVLEPKIYMKQSDIPKCKYDLIFSNEIKEFRKKRYNVTKTEVPFVFCKEINSIIFLKRELDQSGINEKRTPILISTVWLVILESMFDESGNLKNNSNPTMRYFEGIEKFSFINKETFFKIKQPNLLNSIGLKVDYKYDKKFEMPSAFKVSNMTLIEDIKKLSAIFCGKKFEFIDGIESVQKVLPSLQSEMGKEIAKAMVKILEQKVIDSVKAVESNAKVLQEKSKK